MEVQAAGRLQERSIPLRLDAPDTRLKSSHLHERPMRTLPRDAILPSSFRIVVVVAPSFDREHKANRCASKPPASRHCVAGASSPLSIAKRGPYRADGHEHSVRPALKALEFEAAAEFHATRVGLAPAVVNHIAHDQLDPSFA
ncbi:MAG: hypothetical protein F4X97_16550 [Boseongicola sp. SB0662_bin_57]|nr:hypothetical protein [Boseongicola sp. SB0662_bin_57]